MGIATHPAMRSVMVVEDESLVRMMAVDMFEQAGFIVFEAESGDEAALALADMDSIDGLFTDIEMPGATDGLALAKITRRLYPNAAILIVSARETPIVADLPDHAKFIDKPYDNFAIMRTFNELLHKPH